MRPSLLPRPLFRQLRAFGTGSQAQAIRETQHSRFESLASPIDKPKPATIQMAEETALQSRGAMFDRAVKNKEQNDFSKQLFRPFLAGDIYSPHDLSSVEQTRWSRRSRGTSTAGPKGDRPKRRDAFDALNINPILQYKNGAMMSEFVSETGQIVHSKRTGLRPVNQRRLAKAIRRAIGLGMMPSTHRHPAVLRQEYKNISG